MDKKKSILNVSIALIAKIILFGFSLVLKRLLIKNIGNDANGVYSLYTSIMSFMAIAELGIGSAITFSMYKPIVNGENEKVSALYGLYKKLYLIISLIVLAVGIAMMPLIPILAKGYENSFNLYLTFGIMLASVVFEYLFSCKTSLINAYKNNYITTLITSVGMLFRRVAQLFILIFLRSFELYLVAKLFGVLIQWVLTEIYTKKHYQNIISVKAQVEKETKKEVTKRATALFMHKIGSVLVNATDNIIISAVIGVVLLGKYSNYLIIMTSMASILSMFFSPLTSVVGHLCAEGNIQKEKKYFKFMYYLNFTIGVIFYLGYYGVIKDIVGLFFGTDLLLDKSVPLVITINYFIQFIRHGVLLFRDATGTFYYDRWKPVIAGTINVVLSIALVHIIGLVGVIVATIIMNLLVSHIVEPYVLYKHGFKGESPKEYYIMNYLLIAVFVICVFALDFCMQSNANMLYELLINGFIAVGIALIPILILIMFNKTYRGNIVKLFKRVKSLLKNKKNDRIKTAPEGVLDENTIGAEKMLNSTVESEDDKKDSNNKEE